MHMADALLSPSVGAGFWAGTLAALGLASRKLREKSDDRLVPMMGVMAAFIFAGQMVNFTIPGTGSSGHLGGGMILAILLGPHAGFLAIASVLSVQALFFADGGLLALGSNIWNLGIYPCYIAYPFIYRPLAGDETNGKRVTLASVTSVVTALQLGAFSVVVQTVISGRSELPFSAFLLTMQPIHLLIGLVEGVITAGVVSYLRLDLYKADASHTEVVWPSGRNILIIMAMSAALLAGAASWFSSANPDGLEWSIMKVTGKPELEREATAVSETLEKVQKKTSIFPGYGSLESGNPEVMTGGTAGNGLPGLVGGAITFVLVFGAGALIRTLSRSKRRDRG